MPRVRFIFKDTQTGREPGVEGLIELEDAVIVEHVAESKDEDAYREAVMNLIAERLEIRTKRI